jgi:hypothetical protein
MKTTILKTRTKLDMALDRPAEVRPHAAPITLVAAVQAAVGEADARALRPVIRRDAGPAYYPKALLSLLVYAYTREIYGSAEIEDMLRRDSKFRVCYRGEFPDAGMLRRFRRHNRAPIHQCLTRVLTCYGCAGNDEQATEEASRRLAKAMLVDQMELDED